MDHYIDICLLPDSEFPSTVLINILFSKLHRGLVELGTRAVGVSFPDFERSHKGLGEKLRLHSSLGELGRLMLLPWLTGLVDHLEVSPLLQVPQTLQYRVVRRVQAKSSPERLRRRLMKRKSLSEEQARREIADTVVEKLNLPYVTLTSRSTGQHFMLFIEHGPLMPSPVFGSFSSYGLSSSATVPWF